MQEWTKLTNTQFKKYCDIVYRESGISLNEEKRELLNSRLAKRIRKLEIDKERYLSLIQNDPEEMKLFLVQNVIIQDIVWNHLKRIILILEELNIILLFLKT